MGIEVVFNIENKKLIFGRNVQKRDVSLFGSLQCCDRSCSGQLAFLQRSSGVLEEIAGVLEMVSLLRPGPAGH